MRRLFGLGLIVLTPTIALAAAPRTFAELANLIVTFLDSAAGLLVVAGIVIYFYGISTSMFKLSGESREGLKQYMIWGIAVIFVMVSIWGILRILQNTLFDSSPYSAGDYVPVGGGFNAPAFPNE